LEGLRLTRTVFEYWVANAMEWAVILLPLAIYLLVIGLGVNRRRHPVVMSGVWSFLGLLLGLSGFLLIGPPSWGVHLFSWWGPVAYWLGYLLYLVLLGGLGYWLITRQRQVTVIYNIDPGLFAEVLQDVLAETGLTYSATPGRVAFAQGQVVLDLETSYFWSNVTLHWHGDSTAIRQAVEPPLARALEAVVTGAGTAAYLLTAAAVVLLAYVLLASGMFLVVQVGEW
jgi:hypothetical protein